MSGTDTNYCGSMILACSKSPFFSISLIYMCCVKFLYLLFTCAVLSFYISNLHVLC